VELSCKHANLQGEAIAICGEPFAALPRISTLALSALAHCAEECHRLRSGASLAFPSSRISATEREVRATAQQAALFCSANPARLACPTFGVSFDRGRGLISRFGFRLDSNRVPDGDTRRCILSTVAPDRLRRPRRSWGGRRLPHDNTANIQILTLTSLCFAQRWPRRSGCTAARGQALPRFPQAAARAAPGGVVSSGGKTGTEGASSSGGPIGSLREIVGHQSSKDNWEISCERD
jgi:hypothetical protein